MNGTIMAWRAKSHRGMIHAEDGRHIPFVTTAVWAEDVKTIGVGNAVSFEVREGKRPVAIEIRCESAPLVSALKTSPVAGHLQYQGFRHNVNTREYLFQRFVCGQPVEHFVMTVDLALLARFNVTLQQGPAICGHVLTSELKALGLEPCLDRRRALTAASLKSYLDSCASTSEAKPRHS